MSLIILPCLIGVGWVFIFFGREYEHIYEGNNISENCLIIVFCYICGLFFSAVGCIGTGVFWWLKEGAWLSINPYYLFSKLDQGNYYRELVLSKSSWVGLQEISSWYLQQNLAWSFILAIIVLFLVLEFTRNKDPL